MRTLIIILLVLVVVVMFLYMAVNNIEVTVKLDDFTSQLDVFNITDFLSSVMEKKPTIKVGARITVHNTNFFASPVSDLNIDIYDEDTLIARSIGTSKRLIIKKEQYNSFTHSFDVFISALLLDKIKQVQAGQPIKFTYKIKGRVFGLPVKFKNQYNSLL